jgi:hypothetical protein
METRRISAQLEQRPDTNLSGATAFDSKGRFQKAAPLHSGGAKACWDQIDRDIRHVPSSKCAYKNFWLVCAALLFEF